MEALGSLQCIPVFDWIPWKQIQRQRTQAAFLENAFRRCTCTFGRRQDCTEGAADPHGRTVEATADPARNSRAVVTLRVASVDLGTGPIKPRMSHLLHLLCSCANLGETQCDKWEPHVPPPACRWVGQPRTKHQSVCQAKCWGKHC